MKISSLPYGQTLCCAINHNPLNCTVQYTVHYIGWDEICVLCVLTIFKLSHPTVHSPRMIKNLGFIKVETVQYLLSTQYMRGCMVRWFTGIGFFILISGYKGPSRSGPLDPSTQQPTIPPPPLYMYVLSKYSPSLSPSISTLTYCIFLLYLFVYM